MDEPGSGEYKASRPPRTRELKLAAPFAARRLDVSRPPRTRELKLTALCALNRTTASRPPRTRELKLGYTGLTDCSKCRVPRGRVS